MLTSPQRRKLIFLEAASDKTTSASEGAMKASRELLDTLGDLASMVDGDMNKTFEQFGSILPKKDSEWLKDREEIFNHLADSALAMEFTIRDAKLLARRVRMGLHHYSKIRGQIQRHGKTRSGLAIGGAFILGVGALLLGGAIPGTQGFMTGFVSFTATPMAALLFANIKKDNTVETRLFNNLESYVEKINRLHSNLLDALAGSTRQPLEPYVDKFPDNTNPRDDDDDEFDSPPIFGKYW